MYILTNKQDSRIIETLNTPEIIDNAFIRLSGGSLIQLDMVGVVEVDSVPDGAKYYRGKFTNLTVEEEQVILDKLAELDAIMPRVLEDMIEQGNFILHESKLEVIEKKKALRIQLQELEV